MDEAPSWVVLQRIALKLGLILIANGYFTDAGAHIDLERPVPEENETFPRIALAEESSAVTNSALTSDGLAVTTSMQVVAEGYALIDGDDAEQVGHRMKLDITNAFGRIRAKDFEGIEGAQISKFEVSGDRPTFRQPDGLPFIVVQVRATVTMTTYIPSG